MLGNGRILMNGFLAADLGSTNLKVAAYDSDFHLLCSHSEEVICSRDGERTEFDPEAVFQSLLRGLRLCGEAFPSDMRAPKIVLTGQAESLVLSDAAGNPLRPAISWMDGRGEKEAAEIRAAFPEEESRRITGQLSVTTGWPAVKLLWLSRSEPDSFQNARWFFLLKDYILFRLTGKAVGDGRRARFTEEKRRIARKIAEMIESGETLFINSGTTTLYVMEELQKLPALTVVTNSIPLATEFSDHPNFNIILLGGNIDTTHSFTYGDDALAQLRKYRADKLIL